MSSAGGHDRRRRARWPARSWRRRRRTPSRSTSATATPSGRKLEASMIPASSPCRRSGSLHHRVAELVGVAHRVGLPAEHRRGRTRRRRRGRGCGARTSSGAPGSLEHGEPGEGPGLPRPDGGAGRVGEHRLDAEVGDRHRRAEDLWRRSASAASTVRWRCRRSPGRSSRCCRRACRPCRPCRRRPGPRSRVNMK